MKKSTMNFVLGSILSAGGAVWAFLAYRKTLKASFNVIEDLDMRNNTKLDEMESVDADKDPREKGLTQYDSVLKADWVANGFPQTNQELKKGKEISKIHVQTK
ncbi:hypothetical protein CVD28_18920 [Bacillus sp. M6-12]|uniref:hypothetical protein n=1 Tax=Bacillus sp. M6-12 TaxID=2054166 RepID=UPI000C76DCA7|nr:hypothetical protein [Bacillus sp. M6-12]PLS16114.1 hypothetical protein CVD28_18920 [Bacillus sp. M6-12]